MVLVHKRLVFLLVIISLSFTLPAPAQAVVSGEVKAQLETLGIELFTSGDIPYFSTGIGLETREVAYPPFSLKLILANDRGQYLSNVGIKIAAEGGKPVVEAVAEGPWFFVDLESGAYRVEATADGVKKVFSGIRVRKGRTRTMTIYWPSEAVR